MSTSTVSKYKWFWADQDLEQEAWLREMARQDDPKACAAPAHPVVESAWIGSDGSVVEVPLPPSVQAVLDAGRVPTPTEVERSPSGRARRACSKWDRLGEATWTAPTSGSARSSSRSA